MLLNAESVLNLPTLSAIERELSADAGPAKAVATCPNPGAVRGAAHSDRGECSINVIEKAYEAKKKARFRT